MIAAALALTILLDIDVALVQSSPAQEKTRTTCGVKKAKPKLNFCAHQVFSVHDLYLSLMNLKLTKYNLNYDWIRNDATAILT